jgi:hypothetical protein
MISPTLLHINDLVIKLPLAFQVPKQCSGSFRAYIVGQDASDSKVRRLHVEIFQFFFLSFEVYYIIESSKTIANSRGVLNFNWLFLELNGFVCN